MEMHVIAWEGTNEGAKSIRIPIDILQVAYKISKNMRINQAERKKLWQQKT